VAAGKRSKAIPVTCGVAALQFETNIDADCSAVVKGGVLCVTLAGKWSAANGVTGLLNPKGMRANMRQGCRIFADCNTPNGEKSQGRNKSETDTGGYSTPKGRGGQSGQSPVQHARAGELASLFDPLLLKSCGRSLSGDWRGLQTACDAIGDTPHDWLVKLVIERAARPISGIRAVTAICREISHNWRKSKDLPPEKRIPTREEIMAMAAEDKRRRLARDKGRVA